MNMGGGGAGGGGGGGYTYSCTCALIQYAFTSAFGVRHAQTHTSVRPSIPPVVISCAFTSAHVRVRPRLQSAPGFAAHTVYLCV